MIPAVLRRFANSAGGRNFVWLVAEKIGRLVLGVFVGVLVARHLGPADFGRLGAVFSLVALGLAAADGGLEAIVRRELLREPNRARQWLRTAWLVRLSLGALCFLGLGTWAVLGEAEAAVRGLLLIAGLQLFQPALAVGELWLQSSLQAGLAFRMQWPVLLLGAVLRLAAISSGSPLWVFAAIMTGEGLVAAGAVTWAARRRLPADSSGAPRVSAVGWSEWRHDAWPLLISSLAVTVYMRIDLAMLPSLAGQTEAGFYAAAVRLSELGYFLPVALASSVLPRLLEARRVGGETESRWLQRYFDASAALGYGLAGGLALAAPWLLPWAYGGAFSAGVPVLVVHAWAFVFVCLGVARGQHLVNEKRGRFILASTVAGAVLNVLLNLMLVPRHGALGAAAATVASYAVAAWLSSFLHPGLREVAAMQTRALLLPVLGWRYLFSR